MADTTELSIFKQKVDNVSSLVNQGCQYIVNKGYDAPSKNNLKSLINSINDIDPKYTIVSKPISINVEDIEYVNILSTVEDSCIYNPIKVSVNNYIINKKDGAIYIPFVTKTSNIEFFSSYSDYKIYCLFFRLIYDMAFNGQYDKAKEIYNIIIDIDKSKDWSAAVNKEELITEIRSYVNKLIINEISILLSFYGNNINLICKNQNSGIIDASLLINNNSKNQYTIDIYNLLQTEDNFNYNYKIFTEYIEKIANAKSSIDYNQYLSNCYYFKIIS